MQSLFKKLCGQDGRQGVTSTQPHCVSFAHTLIHTHPRPSRLLGRFAQTPIKPPPKEDGDGAGTPLPVEVDGGAPPQTILLGVGLFFVLWLLGMCGFCASPPPELPLRKTPEEPEKERLFTVKGV